MNTISNRKIIKKFKKSFVSLFSHRNKNKNIYHCCIQKTASQWLRQIFSDPIFFQATSLETYSKDTNYLSEYNSAEVQEKLSSPFPEKTIITPLYSRYDEFLLIPKPDNYKVFFVQRDLRDIIVSNYFSYKFSHPTKSGTFMSMRREQLNSMSEDEGLMLMIQDLSSDRFHHISALQSWLNVSNNPRVLISKYEDMVGENNLEIFEKIFEHFDIQMPKQKLKYLLQKYSFNRLSQGRKKGQENQKSHYRKGTPGDWKHYFNELHKESFKEYTGDILIKLGYENTMNW
ncbi:MAG: sulfotransferase domain-containing protein [Crocosphaera sp.]